MTPCDDYDDEAHWQQFGRPTRPLDQHAAAHRFRCTEPGSKAELSRAEQAGTGSLSRLVAKAAMAAFYRDLSGGSSFYGRQTQKETAPSAWSVAGRSHVAPSSQVGFCHLHVQFVDNLSQPFFLSLSPRSLFDYLPSLAVGNCFLKI